MDQGNTRRRAAQERWADRGTVVRQGIVAPRNSHTSPGGFILNFGPGPVGSLCYARLAAFSPGPNLMTSHLTLFVRIHLNYSFKSLAVVIESLKWWQFSGGMWLQIVCVW